MQDDRLRLIFTCCHPALSTEAQVALTLRLLGGLTTAEVARAFLVAEPAMAKRLVRAKHKIRAAHIPYRVPNEAELPERLQPVLAVLYLTYNAGTDGLSGDDLRHEAIRLARAVSGLMPDEAEVAGLLALLLLTESRWPARYSSDGALIVLRDQDRSLWDRSLIEEGHAIVRACLRRNQPGPYQIQAAINAVHADAAAMEATDWGQILALYDQLLAITPTPVVIMNRAIALAVMPMEVVDQRRHRGDAAECGVGALAVVVGDPGRQAVDPLVIGAVQLTVGPLREKGLDEPLGLAIGLGPIRPGPLVPCLDRLDSPLEGGARIGLAVVGQDPFDPDAVAGEPDGGVEQGPAGAAGRLVRNVSDVRQPGGIVDDHLEVVVAEPAAGTSRLGCPAQNPVPATGGDPAELLVVLVDERARVVVDVADRHPRQPIGVAQPAVPGPGEDGVHGRSRVSGQGCQAMWTPAPVDPRPEDRRDLVGWRQARRAVRSGGPILEARPALGPVSGDPLVRGRPADALGFSGLGNWPAVELDPRHQKLPSEHVETGRTMGHESFLRAWVLNTPNHGAKLSFVNNVFGNHI